MTFSPRGSTFCHQRAPQCQGQGTHCSRPKVGYISSATSRYITHKKCTAEGSMNHEQRSRPPSTENQKTFSTTQCCSFVPPLTGILCVQLFSCIRCTNTCIIHAWSYIYIYIYIYILCGVFKLLHANFCGHLIYIYTHN